MGGRSRLVWAAGFATALVACSSGPPPRLDAYLGPGSFRASEQPAQVARALEGTTNAGLVVINDTSAAGSAPALSQEVLDELVRVLRGRLAREIPTLSITTVLQPEQVAPADGHSELRGLARDHDVPYLLLVIFSSNEMESPAYLPLLGIHDGPRDQSVRPGYEVQNFARVELALLDGESGEPLLRADGQAWATLYKLGIELQSNAYPVVVRDRLNYPIFPQESVAYDVLRGVAADSAIDQAIMHFKTAWSRTVAAPAAAG